MKAPTTTRAATRTASAKARPANSGIAAVRLAGEALQRESATYAMILTNTYSQAQLDALCKAVAVFAAELEKLRVSDDTSSSSSSSLGKKG